MNFRIQSGALSARTQDCLIIGIFENNELTPTAKKLDKTSGGHLTKLLKQGDFEGKTGQTFLLYRLPHINADRILLVGCGKNETLTERDYRKIIYSATKALIGFKATHAISFLTELVVAKHSAAWNIKQAVEVTQDALYSFDQYKSTKSPKQTLKEFAFYVADKKHLKACEEGLKQGLAISAGVTLTKNLANQPSNVCTPDYLAAQAKKLAKEYQKIQIKILDKKAMEKLGMGALLAVAKGSD
ncbi:MAG: M17 family peptidase N-terminal domain-containing protein, partial [Gammaproteobacteria bacterium]